MSQKFEKLKTLLKELFQLDKPDLDFGIYRILHARAAEVSQFLDRDLLPQVQAAFAGYRSADKVALEKELAEAEQQARSLGVETQARAAKGVGAKEAGCRPREVPGGVPAMVGREP